MRVPTAKRLVEEEKLSLNYKPTQSLDVRSGAAGIGKAFKSVRNMGLHALKEYRKEEEEKEKELLKQFEEEKKRAEDSAYDEYNKNELVYKNKLLYGDNESKGYYGERRKEASVNMPSYENKMLDYHKRTLKEIGDPELQGRVKRSFDRSSMDFNSRLNNHAFNERKLHEEDVKKESIEALRESAIKGYNSTTITDPSTGYATSTIRDSINKIEGIVKRHANNNGLVEKRAKDGTPLKFSDSVENEILEEKSYIHKNVVKSLIAENKDLSAKEYAKEAMRLNEVSAEDKIELKEIVSMGNQRGAEQRMTKDILDKSRNLSDSLKLIEKVKVEPGVDKALAKDNVKTRIKAHYNTQEDIKESKQIKVLDGAVKNLYSTKGAYDLTQEQMASLSYDKVETFRRIKKSLVNKKVIDTDMKVYDELKTKAVINPDKFLKVYIPTYKGGLKLSEGDQRALINLQNEMREPTKKDDTVRGLRTIRQQVDDYTAQFSFLNRDKKPENYSKFYYEFDAKLRNYRTLNKSEPNEGEVKKMLDDINKSHIVERGLFFDTEKRSFQITIDDIPKNQANKIRQRLKSKNRDSSDRSVVEVWKRLTSREGK